MAEHQQTSVGQIVARLRRMLGHASKRDRETLTLAIDGLEELAARLFDVTHAKPSKGSYEIRKVGDAEPSEVAVTGAER